jgi:hypothetical protein
LPQVLQQRAGAHSSAQDRSDDAWGWPSRQLEQCLRRLSQLPGAACISSSAVSRLLLEASQLQRSGPDASVPALCQLPAAVSVSSHQMAQLLQALEGQHGNACNALCTLPAFGQLTRAKA